MNFSKLMTAQLGQRIFLIGRVKAKAVGNSETTGDSVGRAALGDFSFIFQRDLNRLAHGEHILRR